MFCLRSWLPLLFIPTNASPSFIFLFFVCTYFLNRPCVYCSFLLLVLFLTSCNWSDRCFFDFTSNWFQPRPPVAAADSFSSSWAKWGAAWSGNGSGSSSGCCSGCSNATAAAAADMAADDGLHATAAAAVTMLNTTARAVAGAAADEISRARTEWTGLGMEWLRSLLGRREWRIECLDINIRL